LNVGDRIRECRNLKGLSQSDLGKLIHKSTQVISNWERGYTPNISHEDLLSLSEALNVTIDYLVGKIDSNSSVPDNNQNKVKHNEDAQLPESQQSYTIAAHRSDNPRANLPEPALRSLFEYENYLRSSNGLPTVEWEDFKNGRY
jgi:transcriptional regulator with XRE-family HTH domain